MSNEPLQQEGYDLMAAAFEVYNEMGNGFTEEIYQESLEEELQRQSISFVAQPELTIAYKGKPLKKKFRPDLIAFNDMIVELKAVKTITDEHKSQVLNYLKATGKPIGYLINFGSREGLEWKRFARTRPKQLAKISAD